MFHGKHEADDCAVTVANHMHRSQALGVKKSEGVGNAAGVTVVRVNVGRTPVAGPFKREDLVIVH